MTAKEQHQQEVRNLALHHAAVFTAAIHRAGDSVRPGADEVVNVAQIFEAFLLEPPASPAPGPTAA